MLTKKSFHIGKKTSHEKKVVNEYLDEHMITSSDNKIYTQRYVSYIQVDSSQRNKYPENIYGDHLYSLTPYPIYFQHRSSHIKIEIPNHTFQVDDKIVLTNVVSKNVILKNVISVKKNSYFVRIYHRNHGLSLYGLYNDTNPLDFTRIEYVDQLPASYGELDVIPDILNEYYIANVNTNYNLGIQLSNVKGSDHTRNFIGNIPVNYLNNKQTVYLIFMKNGDKFYSDPDSYLIMLKHKSSINYTDDVNFLKDKHEKLTSIPATNTIHIKFLNLYGIPLNYLNNGTPTSEKFKYPYLNIIAADKNSITLDVHLDAIVDPYSHFYDKNDFLDTAIELEGIIKGNRGGGSQVLLRQVRDFKPGYPNPNHYVYQLENIYKNVIQVRMVGSVFPNSQRIINDQTNDIINNKLYWRNLEDGDYIYQISIEPGNYTPYQLGKILEYQFNHTIRYPYTKEYQNGIFPTIITHATPIDDSKYDIHGINKYHLFNITISDITDRVTFTSYKEIIQSDQPNDPIIKIPESHIQISTDFLKLIDTDEILLIYFTPNSYQSDKNLYHIQHNLYRYVVQPNLLADESDMIDAVWDSNISILMNFPRKRTSHSEDIIYEKISINTNTKLHYFVYNYTSKIVQLPNHKLKVGDLIITDQFHDPTIPNQTFVYEITNIIDTNRFIIKRYHHGEKYKIVYDNLIINSVNQDLDFFDADTFNVNIQALCTNNTLMIVKHPNHQLQSGNKIILSKSHSVNYVPEVIINGEHTIHQILDDDHYSVLLDSYTPVYQPDFEPYIANTVSIQYPNFFQMFFNFPDTLGKILGFDKTGEEIAITPYQHIIHNNDAYINDPNEFDHQIKSNKLDMTGHNYFYICCPELSTISNTRPVSNVFSIIRWFDVPGTVIFDSFVPTIKEFDTPLPSLSELHLSMVHPDGRAVEFNGIDHSFTIEIVELYNQPVGTDISEHTNSALPVREV